MTIQVEIQNISVYRRGDSIIMYIVSRQDQSYIKLFFESGTTTDLFNMLNHKGLIEFDVRINKNLTSTYRNMTVPFFDVTAFKLIKNPLEPTTILN